jgi:hypothetical protein
VPRCRHLFVLCVVLIVACGSRDKPKVSEMTAKKQFDFLAEDIGTRELYARHHGDSPEMIATLRAALRTDARANVRQNSIVALSATPDMATLDDFILGLGDPDPAVVSEAGFSIAAMLKDSSLADATRTRGLGALRAKAEPLRKAFDSTRERVRFNVMTALEAIVDHDFDVARALRDPASLVRNEGLALAIIRANADQKLSAHDVDALIEFVRQTKDARFHDDGMDLLVRFAPAQAGPLLISSIGDDTIGYQGLKHLVEMKLTNAVPAILAYVKAHPDQWSKEHLETLVAFHATCAAPLMADLFTAEHDKVRSAWIGDALRALSERNELSDKDLVGWAKRQVVDAAPCR